MKWNFDIFFHAYKDHPFVERAIIRIFSLIVLVSSLVLVYFYLHFLYAKTFQSIVYYIMPVLFLSGIVYFILTYYGKNHYGLNFFLFMVYLLIWSTMFIDTHNVPVINILDTISYIFVMMVLISISPYSRSKYVHYLINSVIFIAFMLYAPLWSRVDHDVRIAFSRDMNITFIIIIVLSIAINYIYTRSLDYINTINAHLKEENNKNQKINYEISQKNDELILINKELELTRTSIQEVNDALEGTKDRYFGLISQASDGFLLLRNNIIIEYNQKALDLFEISEKEFKDQSIFNFIPTIKDESSVNYRDILEKHIQEAQDGNPQRFEVIFTKGSQKEFLQVEISMARFKLDDTSEDVLISMFFHDVSIEKKNQEFIHLASKIFDNSQEGFIVTNEENIITMVNKAFTQITGYTKEEAIGKNPRFLKSERHTQEFYKSMWYSLLSEGEWKGEIWNRNKFGIEYAEWLNITVIRDDAGKIRQYIGVFHDLTDLKSSQFQVDYLENYDVLTGLVRREQLLDKINNLLKSTEIFFGLIIIGIDNMSKINNKHGYKTGDIVLKRFAERLKRFQNSSLFTARIESDEFAILVWDLKNKEEITDTVFAIKKSLKAPISINTRKLEVTAGIGIAFPESSEETPFTLLDKGYLALQQAKKKGNSSHQLYTPYLDELIQVRLNIENDLKIAVINNEFIMMFQPKFDLDQNKVTGFESLIRWEKDGKLISPVSFISIAEENGLIGEIGVRALEKTCIFISQLNEAGIFDVSIAINVSALQLKLNTFTTDLENILSKYNINPTQLEIEITESSFLYEESAMNPLLQIRNMGIQIALDDFGTGYSSLSYLKKLPIDILKIDKSFVDDIPKDQSAIATIKTILDLANNYSLKVITEGVETKEQKDFLYKMGCKVIQGYYISKPLLDKEALKLMINNKEL